MDFTHYVVLKTNSERNQSTRFVVEKDMIYKAFEVLMRGGNWHPVQSGVNMRLYADSLDGSEAISAAPAHLMVLTNAS